jgi:hypothetical protein
MGGILGLWLIFFVFVVAPVVAVELYVLVWMCGPAIRRASRRVAEGWFEVAEHRARGTAPGASSGVPSGGRGESRSDPRVSDAAPLPPAAEPEPAPQYTITGRRIR